MTRTSPLVTITAVFALLLTTAPAQVTAPAPVTPAPENKGEVVELSPFTVNTSKDLGYSAENTLAGSRLNTRLRDTAGSVAVFTKEFLDDLAITDIAQLLDYSVNAEVDTNAWQAGSGQNPMITGENLLSRTLNRGLAASQGMDFFTSITNGDPYRVGRFEDSRGPNSILFGVGAPGGLLNQSSKVAETHRDTANLRYGFGSWDRSRIEMDANKALIKDRLAVSVAALDQENGGWRRFDFQDKERIFGAVTFRPSRALTLKVMGETGHDSSAVMKTAPPSEQVLAWYDNRQALGVTAVTFTPNNTTPTAAQQAIGVTTRDGNRTGNNHRLIVIENDGTLFDGIGAFLTGSYNSAAVRAPDGTPGVTSSVLQLNDPSLYPRNGNAGGPGAFRRQRLHNYTATLDWQASRNLSFNLAHNYQETTLTTRVLVGNEPTLRGDPNRTLGVNGAANPYAGQLYFDGNWRGDIHYGDYRETRLSASYHLTTKWKWLGRHRIAASVARSKQSDLHELSWLALAGRPFNNTPNNANNRISVRNYLTEGDHGTYRAGDWRTLPSSITFGGRTYDLAFVNDVYGANNSGMTQDMDSMLGVIQSYFFQDKLVTTFGYREDDVTITQLGFHSDPVIGDVVDRDPAKATITNVTGRTLSVGGVYHVLDWVSLIANRSSNVGIPPLARTVFPKGNLAPLSKGEGQDFGVGLDLLEGRLSARLVYFTSNEKGRITSAGLDGAPARNTRVMEAFASALVGPGLPFSDTQWAPINQAYTPPANAVASDFQSEGYEARITANLTRNWRLVANYSYTDSGRKNMAQEVITWYGLKPAENGRWTQGVTQDASGQYVVDPNAFVPGGTIAKWIELGAMNPAADLSTLTTSNSQSVAEEIFTLIDNVNDEVEQQERRWGVRPHKISLFTAYDFKEGALKGFTVGGGWRWRSANVIGEDSRGNEITGRVITAADMMVGYTRKFKGLPGRVRFQVNVSNLFDQTDIIPVRLSTSATAPDGFIIPGRSRAYSRLDLVAPREFRFTTTYSY
ncbi:MAG: TonB-dependent receptor plug domain-containing protein [Opitutaceae bacterium]|nr:TonB-dependent receptor plug domain-containing protein [Opitutaceae bacterium]